MPAADKSTDESGPLIEEGIAQRDVRDAYGLALALILTSIFALIAARVPVTSTISLGAAVLQVVALLVTLRVSGVRRGIRGLVAGVALIVAATAGVALTFGGDLGEKVGLVLWIALTLGTGVAIIRRLLTYRRVNLQAVLGLMCVYLLIGMTFALFYLLVQAFDPNAFSQGPQSVSSAVYFSYISLATVGYGDISPLNSFMRALAVAEAILGQLYLVSVVSLAVSRLGDRGGSRPV
jgi:hypothetical protein